MKKAFIACAHSPGAPLVELVNEARLVEKALQPLKERGLLEVLSNRAANVEDIFQTFSSYPDIQILHYAGHADGDTLYLEEAGNIKGIAELFGLNRSETGQPNTLRFAFINGCSSKGQVANLHEAGVAAVIATSRPIGDNAALVLAEQFYRTWAMEGKTLQEAFETAKARVHAIEGEATRGIVSASGPGKGIDEQIPWGLYLNPAWGEKLSIAGWKLNEPPQLPAMLLSAIKPNATQSLRELVHEFRQTDQEAQQLIRNERKDPLMVLIERLPWIVGTHLRRLFAVEAGQTMTEAGTARLKELIAAYTELTRFISYITLTMLWDAKGEGFESAFPFEVLPKETEAGSVDFVFRTQAYYKALAAMNNQDPLALEPEIARFLQMIGDENNLRPAYLMMEEWKQALSAGEERFMTLVESRASEKPEGVKSLALEAEALYTRFLKASLFLTRYKVHTVRSIVVDKIRNLAADRPFSHYTMSLHAAFSQLQSSLTERETATDNYCILLTERQQQGDALANAINLSPFYIDRSSFFGNSTSNYPAVFALDHYREKDFDKEYVFHYIDKDVNHDYLFARDNQLIIDPYGAVLPEHIEVSATDMERFERIYEQLQKLEQDIPCRE